MMVFYYPSGPPEVARLRSRAAAFWVRFPFRNISPCDKSTTQIDQTLWSPGPKVHLYLSSI
jgi:hypothetical protein